MIKLVSACALTLCFASPLSAEGIPDAARRTIAAANDAWLPAMKRQDAAAVADAYADDAVFVTATGEAATGREGVARLMRERFATARVVDGVLVQDGLRMEGTMIYEWGHAEMEIERAGARVRSSGRYLTVWKRNAAGTWQIVRNLSLPD